MSYKLACMIEDLPIGFQHTCLIEGSNDTVQNAVTEHETFQCGSNV